MNVLWEYNLSQKTVAVLQRDEHIKYVCLREEVRRSDPEFCQLTSVLLLCVLCRYKGDSTLDCRGIRHHQAPFVRKVHRSNAGILRCKTCVQSSCIPKVLGSFRHFAMTSKKATHTKCVLLFCPALFSHTPFCTVYTIFPKQFLH